MHRSPTPCSGAASRVRCRFATALLATCIAFGSAHADELPWLAPTGSIAISITHDTPSATLFHVDDRALDLPFGTIERTATDLGLALSLSNSLTVDLQFGQGRANAPVLGTTRGSTDTRFGAAWRIMDEEAGNAAWKPTLTLRAGAVRAGDYPVDSLHALGTGGSGYEVAAAVGKILAGKLSIGFELGTRRFADPVPARSYLTARAQLFTAPQFLDKLLPDPNGLSLGVTYHRERSADGRVMNSLAFPPSLLPEVQQDFDRLDIGAELTIKDLQASATTYRILDARNAAAYEGLVITVSFNFNISRILEVL